MVFKKENPGLGEIGREICGTAILEAPETQLPLVATRSAAAQEFERQSNEGLVILDDADDAKFQPGLPAGFPKFLNEHGKQIEIVPYKANLDGFAGHPYKPFLTPLTHSWTRTIPELKYLPRSSFNAEGYFQIGDQILCVVPRKTWNKIENDNPGSCKITLDSMNKNSRVQMMGENASKISQTVTDRGDQKGITGVFESEMSTLGHLSEAEAARSMSGQ